MDLEIPNLFMLLANSNLMIEVWKSVTPILDRYYEETGDFSLNGLSYAEMREKTLKYLEEISNGSVRIKTIVDDLKNFSRQEVYCIYEEVDINRVVKNSVEMTSSFINKSTHNFNVEYGKDLPRVKGNFQQLVQVVVNLIHNGCQALQHKQQSIFVTTSCDEEGQHDKITVRDEGIGITSEDISRVKDIFFTTRRRSGGTGLGLSISSKIVKDHSGTIDLISEKGTGTTVTIELPVI